MCKCGTNNTFDLLSRNRLANYPTRHHKKSFQHLPQKTSYSPTPSTTYALAFPRRGASIVGVGLHLRAPSVTGHRGTPGERGAAAAAATEDDVVGGGPSSRKAPGRRVGGFFRQRDRVTRGINYYGRRSAVMAVVMVSGGGGCLVAGVG